MSIDNEPINVFSSKLIILDGIETIIITILFIMYFSIFVCDKGCAKNPKKKTSRSSFGRRSLSQTSKSYQCVNKFHIVVLISLIFSIVYIYEAFYFTTIASNKYNCFYRCLHIAILLLQRLALYCYSIHRVRTSFQGSIYQVKLWFIALLYFVSTFLVVSCIFILIYYSGVKAAYLCNHFAVLQAIIVTFSITDIIFTLYLTALLVSKLFKLLKIQYSDNISQVIQKLTILCVITVISNLIFIILFVLLGHNIFYETLGIDLIINNICLMLSFGKLKHTYHVTCKLCIALIPKPGPIHYQKAAAQSPSTNKAQPEHTPTPSLKYKNNPVPSPIKPDDSHINNKDAIELKTTPNSRSAIKQKSGTLMSEIPEEQTKSPKNIKHARKYLKMNNNTINIGDNNNIDPKSDQSRSMGISTNEDSIGDVITDDSLKHDGRARSMHGSVSIFTDTLRHTNDKTKGNSKYPFNSLPIHTPIEEEKDDLKTTHLSTKKPMSKSITDTLSKFVNLVLDINYDLSATKDETMNTKDRNYNNLKAKTPKICGNRLREMGIILS